MRKKIFIFLSAFMLILGGVVLTSCNKKKDNADTVDTVVNKRLAVFNALVLDDEYFIDMAAKDYGVDKDNVVILTTDWIDGVTAETTSFKVSLKCTTDDKVITVNYVVMVDDNVTLTIEGKDEITFGSLDGATEKDVYDKYDVIVINSLGQNIEAKIMYDITGDYDLDVEGVYDVTLTASISQTKFKTSKDITIKVLKEYTANYYEADGETLNKKEEFYENASLTSSTTTSLASDTLYDYTFNRWIEKTTFEETCSEVSKVLETYDLNDKTYYYDKTNDLFYPSIESYVYNNVDFDDAVIKITKDIDLVPLFTPTKRACQIKMITNDGTINNNVIKVEDNYYAFILKDNVITLENSSKENYNFVGWFIDEDLSVACPNTTAENITVYAKYENYAISFVSEYGTSPSDIEGVINIPATLPTLENRELENFEGWYLDEACTIPAICGEAICKDTILYAKWLEKPFNVTLLDGETTVDVISMTHFDSNLLPTLDDKELYTFKGWENGLQDGTRLTQELTLASKWEHKKFTINYSIKDNIASSVANVDLDYVTSDTLTAPEINNHHYQFTGWTYDNDGKTLASVGDEITKNTTLYAQFKRVGYYYTGTMTTLLTEYDIARRILGSSTSGTSHSDGSGENWGSSESTSTGSGTSSSDGHSSGSSSSGTSSVFTLNNSANSSFDITILETKTLEKPVFFKWEIISKDFYDYGDGDEGYTYTYAPVYLIPVLYVEEGTNIGDDHFTEEYLCIKVVDMTQNVIFYDYDTVALPTELSFDEAYNSSNTHSYWCDIEWDSFGQASASFISGKHTFKEWIDDMLNMHEYPTEDIAYSYSFDLNVKPNYTVVKKYLVTVTPNQAKNETIPTDYSKEFYSCFNTSETQFTTNFYWYSQKDNGEVKISTFLYSDIEFTTDIYGEAGTNKPVGENSWSN